jgi:hypothetical protein
MIKAASYTKSIIKVNAITLRVYLKVDITKKDLISLLNYTYNIIALLLDS